MEQDNHKDEKAGPANAGKHIRVKKILRYIYTISYSAFLLFLTVMYLFIGDKSAFGELITIAPPLLWSIILLPMALTFFLIQSRSKAAVAILAVFIFLALTEEWRSLFRFGTARQRNRFESLHRVSSGQEKAALRIITWNLDGASSQDFLPILEEKAPDICFLQETPDGGATINDLELEGFWQDYHWIDAGDCGVLSRFPIRRVATESVGPWSNPLLLELSLPNERKALLVNVRLMLPTLWFNVLSAKERKAFIDNHRVRVKQYGRLADLIAEHDYETVILAGDFNAPAAAHSLEPLREILQDSWLEGGTGWGRTILASFPLSRIDHCWVSANVQCVYGSASREVISDHLLLLFELIAEGEL